MTAATSQTIPEMRKHIKRLERQVKERTSRADRFAAKFNAREEADKRMRYAYAVARELDLPDDGARFLVAFAREQEADYATVGTVIRTALDIGEPYWGKSKPKVVSLFEGAYEGFKRNGEGHEWATTFVPEIASAFAKAQAAADLKREDDE